MIEVSELGNEILVPEIKIDSELDIDSIDRRFVKILKHFEPFGPGNMTPIFLTRNVQVVGEPRVFNGYTYVFRVRTPLNSRDNESKNHLHGSHVVECVYFRPPSASVEMCDELKTGAYIDIVYSVEENHWNDKTKTQLRIRDFKFSTI